MTDRDQLPRRRCKERSAIRGAQRTQFNTVLGSLLLCCVRVARSRDNTVPVELEIVLEVDQGAQLILGDRSAFVLYLYAQTDLAALHGDLYQDVNVSRLIRKGGLWDLCLLRDLYAWNHRADSLYSCHDVLYDLPLGRLLDRGRMRLLRDDPLL